MSKFEIKMPKLGESITEGTIMKWSVKKGDVIQEDEVLFEVSTAKVSAEIPSPVAGTLVEILVQEGETAPVGAVVALVLLEGETDDSVSTDDQNTVDKESAEPVPAQQKEAPVADRWYSPVVLRLANEAGIQQDELNRIPGTGFEGRLSKKDIKDYIEIKQSGKTSVARKETKTASEQKVAVPQESKPGTTAAPAAPAKTAPSVPVGAGDEVKEMNFVRRIIADRMVESKRISPHVTTVIEVDVTKLVRWRDKHKDDFKRQEGINLTYMPAFVEAVSKALIEFPQVNASVDGYNVILKKNIRN